MQASWKLHNEAKFFYMNKLIVFKICRSMELIGWIDWSRTKRRIRCSHIGLLVLLKVIAIISLYDNKVIPWFSSCTLTRLTYYGKQSLCRNVEVFGELIFLRTVLGAGENCLNFGSLLGIVLSLKLGMVAVYICGMISSILLVCWLRSIGLGLFMMLVAG